jgi:exopolysaccharide production protein ExoZ
MNEQTGRTQRPTGENNPGITASKAGSSAFRLQLIQAFRGLAAILVVFYHAGSIFSKNLGVLVYDNAFKFGHTGVTFFFVLSGFIIYFIHAKDLGKAERLPLFLYKRLTRIYPLYWIVLSVKMLTKPAGILSLGAALTLFPIPDPLVSVSWTLSFEILFYLCFGILIMASTKKIRLLFFPWLGVIVIRTGAGMAGMDPFSGQFYLAFLTSPHILEFVLGGLAGYLVMRGGLQKWRLWILSAGLSLYALFSVGTVLWVNRIGHVSALAPYDQAELIACYFEQNTVLFFGIPSFLILLGAGLIDRFGKARVPGIFLKIGDASYSIYLVHATIINSITLKLGSLRPEQLRLAVPLAIASAVLAGYVVHLSIERPLLAFFAKRSGWFLAKPLKAMP